MSGPPAPPREYPVPHGKPGYEKVTVSDGGGAGTGGFQKALETIRSILRDPSAFLSGKPQWKNPQEIDAYLTGKGFRLTNAQKMGPAGKPDGQQLIYEGPNNVIVKVKTRGYGDDGHANRRGVPTMSIEATDGKGTGWGNALFKVDSDGKVLAKSISGAATEIQRLPLDHQARLDARKAGQPEPEWGIVQRDGSLRAVTKFEMIEGGANSKPINIQEWADASHLNFPEGFDPRGADRLAAQLAGGGKPPTGGGGPPTPPPRPTVPTRIKGIGLQVASVAVTVFLGFAQTWLKRKLGIDDETLIKQQLQGIVGTDVTEYLNKNKTLIAILRNKGFSTYANVTVTQICQIIIDPDTRTHVYPPPAIALDSVGISENNVSQNGGIKTWAAGDTIFRENSYTFSFEITLPQEDLNWYKWFSQKYDDVQAQLKNPRLTSEQRRDLEQQKDSLLKQLAQWNYDWYSVAIPS